MAGNICNNCRFHATDPAERDPDRCTHAAHAQLTETPNFVRGGKNYASVVTGRSARPTKAEASPPCVTWNANGDCPNYQEEAG